MASPTKRTWNRRDHRDAKLLRRRQKRVRKDQVAQASKIKKLLGK